MSATLHQIARYLENCCWKYDLQVENSHIITGVKADHFDPFFIVITLKDGGDYLELRAPQLLYLKDHIYKQELEILCA